MSPSTTTTTTTTTKIYIAHKVARNTKRSAALAPIRPKWPKYRCKQFWFKSTFKTNKAVSKQRVPEYFAPALKSVFRSVVPEDWRLLQ